MTIYNPDTFKVLYDVKVEYFNSGIVKKIEFFKDGKLHRAGDQPALMTFYESGLTFEICYYEGGDLHHDDFENSPAYISFFEDGKIKETKFYYYGHLGRTSGPAWSLNSKTDTGRLKRVFETYYSYDEIHRKQDDKESYAVYQYADGHLKRKIAYFRGKKHAIGYPAIVEIGSHWSLDAKHTYYDKGKISNDFGPAIFNFDNDGVLVSVAFYKKGNVSNPYIFLYKDLDYEPYEKINDTDYRVRLWSPCW
jgi:antitoxin component YwqK of YwqJK toxin-antitoxin module